MGEAFSLLKYRLLKNVLSSSLKITFQRLRVRPFDIFREIFRLRKRARRPGFAVRFR